MSASVLISVPFLLFSSFPGWTDPSGDVFETATTPALDLVGLDVSLQAENAVFTLNFDPNSTAEEDLYHLSGFIDLDTDLNTATGRSSHFEDYDREPFPELGVDYYLTLWPDTGLAEVTHVANGVTTGLGYFVTVQTGLSVSVAIPRCQHNPDDGICIGDSYRVVSIIGNLDGGTDRIPNGSFPLTEGVGDFDHSGSIDDADASHMHSCQGGPGAPFANGCADADLDHDGDVDQDDFGILQRYHTGP